MPSETTADLIASGYRAISNRYRMIARIDREDWREEMARRHVAGFPGDQETNFQRGMCWVNSLGSHAADLYRRVYSKDVLEGVNPAAFERIRKSGDGFGGGRLNEFRSQQPRKSPTSPA
jgi:hypothetical protein